MPSIKFYESKVKDHEGKFREIYEFDTGKVSAKEDGSVIPITKTGYVDADIIKENRQEYEAYKASSAPTVSVKAKKTSTKKGKKK